jgi:hypothetical protein
MLKDNVPVNAPLDLIKTQKVTEVEKLSKAMTESTHRWRRKLRVIAKLLLFCRSAQFSLTNSYVDDNSCLICE